MGVGTYTIGGISASDTSNSNDIDDEISATEVILSDILLNCQDQDIDTLLAQIVGIKLTGNNIYGFLSKQRRRKAQKTKGRRATNIGRKKLNKEAQCRARKERKQAKRKRLEEKAQKNCEKNMKKEKLAKLEQAKEEKDSWR